MLRRYRARMDMSTDFPDVRGAASRRSWLRRAGALALSPWLPMVPVAAAVPPLSSLRPVMPFSESAPGEALPPGWVPHRMRPDRCDTLYRTVPDPDSGRTVLQARSERGATGLRHDLRREPGEYRWLEFGWCVSQVPEQARSDDDSRDDCPARVVVAFDGDLSGLSLREMIFREQVELFTGHTLPHSTLMYVWDGQLPVGAAVAYPRSSSIRYLVVDSGAAEQGRWRWHRRDLVADYRAVFGREPGPIRSIGVVTDSDDLGGAVETLYGDIRLPAPEADMPALAGG